MPRSPIADRLTDSEFATLGPHRWLAVALGAQRDALESALARLESPERDAEAVHDVRVTTRRLRGILDAGSDFITGAGVRKLAKRLKLVRRELGVSREAEVGAELLAERREKLPAPTRAAAAAVAARFLGQRDRFERDKADIVSHLELRRLRKRLGRVIRSLNDRDQPPTGEASMSLHEFRGRASSILRERWTTLVEAPLEPIQQHDAVSQHEFRIKGKKLRYALELFAPLFPKAIDRRIALLRSMQDQLGHLHDLADLADEARDMGFRVRQAGFSAEASAFGDLADLLDAERRQGLAGFGARHQALVHPGFLPPASRPPARLLTAVPPVEAPPAAMPPGETGAAGSTRTESPPTEPPVDGVPPPLYIVDGGQRKPS